MSTLNVNTLADSNGTGNINVQSEGGSVTTNLQQGLCKCWIKYDGESSGAPEYDSFNSSSTTDNGTGDYTFTITNDMASANYSHPIVPADADGGGGLDISVTSKAAGSIRVGTIRDNSTKTDNANVSVSIFGDLA